MEKTLPKQILQYAIIEELGHGPAGQILKAWDTGLERIVCLKLIRPELMECRGFKARCLSTRRGLSEIAHPNIGNIFGMHQTDGQYIIVEEYIDGMFLDEQIARGPMEINAFLNTATQIAAGLDQAHSKLIIHGNLKPTNIIIQPDGHVKIVDFGLSTLPWEREHSEVPHSIKDARYRSPEEISSGEVSPLSDLFSLGAIFFELLSGEPAFKGPNPREIQKQIQSRQTDPDLMPTRAQKRLPGDCILMVNKLLAHWPNERFKNTTQLMITLEEMKSFEEGTTSRTFLPVWLDAPRMYLMISVLVALLVVLWLVLTTN